MENSKSITVYFDTNFYIWLAKAEPSVADSVIERLNNLKIRHVLSSHILHELLSGAGRDLQDQRLVDRLNQLSLEPFRIQNGQYQGVDSLQWELLTLKGTERNLLAKFLQSVFDSETVSRSLSSVAEKKLNQNDHERVEEAVEPFLYALGITSESSDADRIQKFSEFGNDLLDKLGGFLPPDIADKLKSIDISPEAIDGDPTLIAKNIFAALGKSHVERLESERDLINSVVALDPRPFNTVVGDVSSKEFFRLGNTFRDAIHMGIFLANYKQIDLMQVDLPQFSLIQRSNPVHALRKAGLADRCFAVENIRAAISYIEKYAATREN